MRTVLVQLRQGLLDVAIQQYGTAEAAFQLAFDNNMSVADDLQPAQALAYSQSEHPVSVYLNARNYHPATAQTTDDFNLDGIGIWGIEIDFIVR